MVVPCSVEKTYDKIKNIEVIERIGYDVSVSDIKESSKQRFVFDRYTINEMIDSVKNTKKVVFVISASSHKPFCKSQSVNWLDVKQINKPSLVINYIKKRRHAPPSVKNLRHSIENDIIKLEWDIPNDEAYKGAIVVKNAFKIPCSPYDGQKLYGGMDNYTYDNFGDKDVHKYYAVFSYDDVPNFSEPIFIEVNKP